MKRIILLSLIFLLGIFFTTNAVQAAVKKPCSRNIQAAKEVYEQAKIVVFEGYLSYAKKRTCNQLNRGLNNMDYLLDLRYSCRDWHAVYIGEVSFDVFEIFELGSSILNEKCARQHFSGNKKSRDYPRLKP